MMSAVNGRWSRSQILCGKKMLEYHSGNCHYYTSGNDKASWYKIDRDFNFLVMHSKWANGYIFTHIVGCHPAPALFGAE